MVTSYKILSKTSYGVFGVQCKMKMWGPLLQSLRISRQRQSMNKRHPSKCQALWNCAGGASVKLAPSQSISNSRHELSTYCMPMAGDSRA